VCYVPQAYEICRPDICYYVFSSLQREHLYTIPLDRQLARYTMQITYSGTAAELRYTVLEDICGLRIRGGGLFKAAESIISERLDGGSPRLLANLHPRASPSPARP
jgi:hypothetical protein